MLTRIYRNYTRNAPILLSAVLVGAVLGPLVLPPDLPRSLHLGLGYGLAYLVASLAALLFLISALVHMDRAWARQKQLDQNLLEAFLAYIPDNVYFKDLESRFVRISRSMANYFGLDDPSEVVNKTDADIFSSEHAARAISDEREIIRTGVPIIDKEEKETWPDGRETWALTTKLPLKDRDGRIIGTMGISHNITDRKLAESKVRHMALHDALTGLPNRLLLEDRLTQAIASARRNGQKLAVFLLNIDRFKSVNDCIGFHAGDLVLELVAQRLKRVTRASDTLARLGGDEFVIACSGIVANEEIEQIANKIQRAFLEPLLINQEEVQLTPSIGIAQFPEHGDDPELLLQGADTAMDEAKKKGRGKICLYSPTLTVAKRTQDGLNTDLLNAYARDEFVIHYQPFIDSETCRITGMEALLRWNHPKLGLIAPDRFIPQLEEFGMMNEVGSWVLRTACRQAKEWELLNLFPVRIAVNVSSQQFYEGNIVHAVESALRDSQLDAKALEIELTESRMLDDSEATLTIMRRLKQIGVSLSLDDFGTGWSSLSYLRHFPLDRIKIDRSFVRDLDSQQSAKALVKSILALSQNLGFSNIAEGVETVQQRDLLKGLKCREMQGFLFSRPLAAIDALAFIRTSSLTVQTSRQPDVQNPGRQKVHA